MLLTRVTFAQPAPDCCAHLSTSHCFSSLPLSSLPEGAVPPPRKRASRSKPLQHPYQVVNLTQYLLTYEAAYIIYQLYKKFNSSGGFCSALYHSHVVFQSSQDDDDVVAAFLFAPGLCRKIPQCVNVALTLWSQGLGASYPILKPECCEVKNTFLILTPGRQSIYFMLSKDSSLMLYYF